MIPVNQIGGATVINGHSSPPPTTSYTYSPSVAATSEFNSNGRRHHNTNNNDNRGRGGSPAVSEPSESSSTRSGATIATIPATPRRRKEIGVLWGNLVDKAEEENSRGGIGGFRGGGARGGGGDGSWPLFTGLCASLFKFINDNIINGTTNSSFSSSSSVAKRRIVVIVTIITLCVVLFASSAAFSAYVYVYALEGGDVLIPSPRSSSSPSPTTAVARVHERPPAATHTKRGAKPS